MLGAYTVLVGTEVGVPVLAMLVITPLVVGAFGIVIEGTVIRRLYSRPLDTLLATWGLSLVIRQVVTIVLGAQQRGTDALLTGTVSILGVDYPVYRIFIMLVALLVGVGFFWVIFRTDFGVKLRAVIRNREMASALGVDSRRVDALTFAGGAGVAGLAGAIVSPLGTVNPNMGLPWLIDSFLVVIMGGESAPGPVVGAVFVGGAESTLAFFMQPVTASMLVLIIAIVALRFRPQGLAGGRRKS
jgi:branched-subunit amino acid ABC-type transport system permease component